MSVSNLAKNEKWSHLPVPFALPWLDPTTTRPLQLWVRPGDQGPVGSPTLQGTLAFALPLPKATERDSEQQRTNRNVSTKKQDSSTVQTCHCIVITRTRHEAEMRAKEFLPCKAVATFFHTQSLARCACQPPSSVGVVPSIILVSLKPSPFRKIRISVLVKPGPSTMAECPPSPGWGSLGRTTLP